MDHSLGKLSAEVKRQRCNEKGHKSVPVVWLCSQHMGYVLEEAFIGQVGGPREEGVEEAAQVGAAQSVAEYSWREGGRDLSWDQ